MDGSYNKRAVRENSGPKKKQPAAVKDSASSHDGTGQLCNRIGCGGQLNNNNTTKSTKDKTLEKPKPLKPSFCALSSKSFKGGGTSKNISKSIENTQKKAGNCLRGQTSESNNGGRKRLARGESSSLGKGKKIIDVSANEAHVSGTKSSRNVNSSRKNGGSSGRTRKLNLEVSKGSVNQQSSSVITSTPPAQESRIDGDHGTSDGSNVSGRGQLNINGIADALLALDRYQQDEELTYEQILSLEANLFFGWLNLFDQHRDMRLDIDNMSYEELLVLEEKMGTVSTALSEEELSKCIKTSVYESLQSENEKTKHALCAEDSKCSICQEEFVRGDEVGRLECGHGYHTPCINQWLGLKNWCPICKASPTTA
ncbi:uncharacterized protein LOC143568379 [Bidens hawaiensis]|uniref:uncharacterized protein LOC143568379 n=1 Tax=Bidens hawaiensis TaxID=980011 RepID=UPI00404B4991